MAKKKKEDIEEIQRQSRKEILVARKNERQTRQIRLAILSVVALLVLVLVIGMINELAIKPGSPVAVVNGTELPLKDWQDRVRFQRAQLIIGIEDLAEAFNQDIGQVQQFAGQQINLLEDPESMGQLVLDELVNEELIRQAAADRGITVSDDDVQEEIETTFNYFGGGLPTPMPTATETPIPTPSLTPIPTQVITEVLATSTPFPSPTAGPTSTPLPTATPVSIESFQESYNGTLDDFANYGIDEPTFREVIKAQLLEERFQEALATEEELPSEAEHASFYYLVFDNEEEANDTASRIIDEGFLPVWNIIRSTPPDAASESTAAASEVIWRTQDDLESTFGSEVAVVAMTQSLQEPSSVIVLPATDGSGIDRYLIIMVSGREVRPLSEAALRNAKQELLQSWLEIQRLENSEIFERWRANVPKRPVLDRRFLLPPTPTPLLATVEIPEIEVTPAE